MGQSCRRDVWVEVRRLGERLAKRRAPFASDRRFYTRLAVPAGRNAQRLAVYSFWALAIERQRIEPCERLLLLQICQLLLRVGRCRRSLGSSAAAPRNPPWGNILRQVFRFRPALSSAAVPVARLGALSRLGWWPSLSSTVYRNIQMVAGSEGEWHCTFLRWGNHKVLAGRIL